MSKRKGKKGHGMKAAAAAALAEFESLRRLAHQKGLRLRYSTLQCGRNVVTTHWMFDDLDTERRVMNYWPGTGRWNNDGRRDGLVNGKAANPMEALRKAVELREQVRSSVVFQAEQHLGRVAQGV